MSDGIGVRHFEAAFLQILAVIEHGAANEKGALWIDNEPHVLSWNKDVALLRALHQIHHVLETGAATTNHLEAQRALRLAFFLKK